MFLLDGTTLGLEVVSKSPSEGSWPHMLIVCDAGLWDHSCIVALYCWGLTRRQNTESVM